MVMIPPRSEMTPVDPSEWKEEPAPAVLPLTEGECAHLDRVVSEVQKAKVALADADMTVAQVEAQRHGLRLKVQEAVKALHDLAGMLAKTHQVEPNTWGLDLDRRAFVPLKDKAPR